VQYSGRAELTGTKLASNDLRQQMKNGVHWNLMQSMHSRQKKKKRGYRVCSSGYAATDTS
jgi:hypothetical protein